MPIKIFWGDFGPKLTRFGPKIDFSCFFFYFISHWLQKNTLGGFWAQIGLILAKNPVECHSALTTYLPLLKTVSTRKICDCDCYFKKRMDNILHKLPGFWIENVYLVQYRHKICIWFNKDMIQWFNTRDGFIFYIQSYILQELDACAFKIMYSTWTHIRTLKFSL